MELRLKVKTEENEEDSSSLTTSLERTEEQKRRTKIRDESCSKIIREVPESQEEDN